MPRAHDPAALVRGILAGDRLSLARAISQVENGTDAARPILQALYPHTGQAHLMGITGAPGTGKSTLVSELAQGFRAAGQRVAILAVDPTSPFTGGALLGDRVRMTRLSGDPDLFIRSMATRGHLGGLSAAAGEAALLLDAAGFERILIETVGVGQAEVEIAGLAHTTVVVEAPGMGDEVQAIKAGVLEIGDLFVVNKAERPGAERTVTALEMMLHLDGGSRTLRHHGQWMAVALPEADPAAAPAGEGWTPQVLKTTASAGEGVAALLAALEAHRAWLHESGGLIRREAIRLAHMVEQLVHAELNRRLRQSIPQARMAELLAQVHQRQVDPFTAAEQILGDWQG